VRERAGKEAMMAKGNDKRGKEKRKPKKEKSIVGKATVATEVLQHVAQQPPKTEDRDQ